MAVWAPMSPGKHYGTKTRKRENYAKPSPQYNLKTEYSNQKIPVSKNKQKTRDSRRPPILPSQSRPATGVAEKPSCRGGGEGRGSLVMRSTVQDLTRLSLSLKMLKNVCSRSEFGLQGRDLKYLCNSKRQSLKH